MSTFIVGQSVTCGRCGKATFIKDVFDVAGETSLLLECGHRNGVCPRCQVPVDDVSDTHREVHRLCPTCTPVMTEDDSGPVEAPRFYRLGNSFKEQLLRAIEIRRVQCETLAAADVDSYGNSVRAEVLSEIVKRIEAGEFDHRNPV